MNLRIFAREAFIYAAGNIGLRAAALLLTPVYTYSLTVRDFGAWATIQVTIQIILIVVTLGMRETYLRYSKEYADGDRLRHLIGTTTAVILIGGLGVTAVCVGALAPFFSTVLGLENVRLVLALTCTAALVQSLTIHIMSYYRSGNQASRFMKAGLSGAVLLLVSTTVFVCLLNMGVLGALYGYITAYSILLVCVAVDVFRQTGLGLSLKITAQLLKFGAPLTLSTVGQYIVTSANIYLLSYHAGLETVAVFSLGAKFASIMPIVVALPFQLAFQPLVYSNLADPEIRQQVGRLFTYMLLATCSITVLVLTATRVLLPLVAPPAYSAAFAVTLCLLIGQACAGVHCFGETMLGAVHKTYTCAVLNTACAVVSVSLGLVLIPRYGWPGAAVAMVGPIVLVDGVELILGMRAFNALGAIETGRVAMVLGLFGAFLSVSFILRNAGPALFYGGMALLLVVGFSGLYAGPFCRVQEREFVKEVGGRLRAFLPVREA